MVTVSSILLSAFEPFGKSDVNASQEALKRLIARHPEIESLVLPVVRWEAQKPVLERLQKEPIPALYLALGEAGPEPVVRLERIAHNQDDFRLPDNAGNVALREAIEPSGPIAYEASLPVDRIATELDGKTPLPVIISQNAGAFLCNHLAYAVSHHLSAHPLCPFCFVHLPAWRPENGEEALDAIVETIEQIIEATFTREA